MRILSDIFGNQYSFEDVYVSSTLSMNDMDPNQAQGSRLFSKVGGAKIWQKVEKFWQKVLSFDFLIKIK